MQLPPCAQISGVLPTLYSNPRMPCRKHSRANKPLIPYSTNEYKLFTNDTSGIQKVPIYSIDERSVLTLLIKLRAQSDSYLLVSRDISRIKYILNNFAAAVITNFVNSLVFLSLGSLLLLCLLFLAPRVSPFCLFSSRLLRI